MSKKEKALERGLRKEFMVEMSKLGILEGKSAWSSTPSPSWKLNSDDYNDCFCFKTSTRQFLSSAAMPISARKLGARFWELQQFHHPFVRTCRPAAKTCVAREGDGGIKEFDADSNVLDQPGTVSLRKHVVATSQTTSSLSSMQMSPYNPTVTWSNALVHKQRMRDSFKKTSAELLNVFTHIMALEERHASNSKIVKALKKEVDRSHARIEELHAEKQTDRQAIRDLKRIAESKFKCSERVHKKQVEDLSRVKRSLSDALRELEREREAQTVLERLCDEFAKGIRDYEQEIPSSGHKHPILRISKAWLNQRTQIKQKGHKETAMDKLSLDMEAFLESRTPTRARRIPNLTTDGLKVNCLTRHSLDSIPLNQSISALPGAADGGNISCPSDSCSNESMKSQQDEKILKGQSIPTRKHKLTSVEMSKFKSSLRLKQPLQENSLRAKLLEARLEGRQQRSRSLR